MTNTEVVVKVPIEVVVFLVMSAILVTWMLAHVLRKPVKSVDQKMLLKHEDTGKIIQVEFMACVFDEDDGSHQIRVSGRMGDAPHVAAFLACLAIQDSEEGIEMTLQKIQDEAMAMARAERRREESDDEES